VRMIRSQNSLKFEYSENRGGGKKRKELRLLKAAQPQRHLTRRLDRYRGTEGWRGGKSSVRQVLLICSIRQSKDALQKKDDPRGEALT